MPRPRLIPMRQVAIAVGLIRLYGTSEDKGALAAATKLADLRDRNVSRQAIIDVAQQVKIPDRSP
jgi:hypothetical protein